jgi:hypothetical protein
MYLHRLIYTSRRNKKIELNTSNLLGVSRKNNALAGVTGILFFDGNHFVQALEGPREGVEEVYRRIAADDRHYDLLLISRANIKSRRFSQWSMVLHEGMSERMREQVMKIFALKDVNFSTLNAKQTIGFLEKVSRITRRLDELHSLLVLKS